MRHFHFRFSYLRAFLFLQIFFAAAIATPCAATIRYEISLAKRSEHRFQVAVTVPDVRGELILQMPAWNALYEIRDFSSRIQRVEASIESHPLPAEKIDKLSWRVRGEGTITVAY